MVEGRTRINVKLTEPNGKVTDFNFSGFEITKQDWTRFVNDTLSWAGQFDMICVSGSVPPSIDLNDFTAWMKRLRSECMCLIFDSSREAFVAGVKSVTLVSKTQSS